ncbi:MAG: hypothetical protein ABIN48_04780 [Ginsengibacter sp.]
MKLYHSGLFLILLNFLTSCNGQIKNNQRETSRNKTEKSKTVGGGCDGCEIMYVGMPDNIGAVDTSEGWTEIGQKLIVTGTVYNLDGKTPAGNVVVYYWQTDNNGYYTPKPEMDEKARRHGHIRGWSKTGKDGKYAIYTIRPGPYPKDVLPAHIHFSIKEPDVENEYYTDDINFDDDKLLIPYLKKHPQKNRAGSGLVRILLKGDIQIAEHDIVLGLNIPNYPKKISSEKHSGLNIGEDQPSFIPFHAFGPDKGSQACPVCKYGRYHGIVYFVGNNPNWEEIKKWLLYLEDESIRRQKYLKAYFVYGNDHSYSKETRQSELEQVGKELNLKKVALTFVPSFSDTRTEANLNKINPNVENTFIIYKHRSIIDKYIDLKPTAENFAILSETFNKTKGEYFDLPEPKHD